MSHLMVVAAGTGGHVMPGLAVAEALRSRGWTVSWLGTRAGMERSLVEPRGIAFDAIDFSSLRGRGIGNLLLGGFRLLRAIWQSRAVIGMRRPRVVFSTGGYVAVPAGLAASMASVPLTLLNADAAPLLSTRMLRALSCAVFCGFDGAAARTAGERGLVTGNPVRAQIAALPAPAQRFAGRHGPLKLLVIGGSLGSRVLNETVPAAVALLPADRRPAVVHQCGADHAQATRAAYERAGVTAEVLPFIDDIALRYGEADLVICRAGAITVTELAAAGVASLLVPLVVSTTAHQRSNAQFMAAQGAALHLPQTELAAGPLAALLGEMRREHLLEMAERARALGRPQATRMVADAIEHIAREAGR
ncbi:MAG: undecaprenyldiphospho-muramoylpentapeptide beta-N-acetylglucosaminyltransferase [Burkholderiaceae bacterium]|nr:undecaprenyldiphospho-muramoylpentapeptide beta-N-acetylglucosaminyltransferase [Burkholderiaceae bacterium]